MFKIKLKIFSLLIFTLLSSFAYSSNIYLDIRIYSTVNIQKVQISIFSGKYELLNNENVKHSDLYKNNVITVQAKNSKVEVLSNNQVILSSDRITVKGTGFINTFEIEALKPSYARRIYDDNIVFTAKGNNLMLINNIELERYVSGVVESEGGGSSKDHDFFLVQAITVRTYALANVRKHWQDGHHLCDDVHCQAYKGRCKLSHIMMAASQTAGLVLVDESNKMISAAFHSNSGGETVNSEDVWTIATPYLKAVVDTFSQGMRNYTWERRMLTSEWLNKLKQFYNYPIDNPEKKELALNFKQETRKVNFPENIPLKNIRRDFNLRSTFFSVIHMGDSVILNGRGFGHGVGMSQEGAIRMIQLGHTYKDVINFYYRNVTLKSFEELDYFFINYNY